MTRFRTITLVFLTVVVAVAAGFMLGRYDMQKEQEKLLMKPPTRAFASKNAAYADIDTSDWKEYCNQEFDYCVKYPAQTWEVSVEDGGAFVNIGVKNEHSNIRRATISVYNKNASNLDPSSLDYYEHLCGLGVIPPLKFSRIKGVHIDACSGSPFDAYITHKYIIRTSNKTYKLGIGYFDENLKPNVSSYEKERYSNELHKRKKLYTYDYADDYDLSIPRAILNTFRFIETP